LDDDVDVSRSARDMISATALIPTFNEKENIRRTFSALGWAEHVVVIDSFSTDNTVELARTAHPSVEIVVRQFDSFAEQCNFGLNHVKTPWVLSIDADYVLTSELIDELMALEPPDQVAGYAAEFRYCVFGRPLRSTLYPARTVLYRRDRAHYDNEGHGHRVRVSGLVRRFAGKIDHDDRKPLIRWMASQDRYSIIEARHLLASGSEKLSRVDRLRKCVFIAPAAVFFYLLFVRGLILDGWRGWYYVCQRTIAEMLLSLRLITQRRAVEQAADKEASPT
jgi:glycosyltransferase involved in cell wall biosynthesis